MTEYSQNKSVDELTEEENARRFRNRSKKGNGYTKSGAFSTSINRTCAFEVLISTNEWVELEQWYNSNYPTYAGILSGFISIMRSRVDEFDSRYKNLLNIYNYVIDNGDEIDTETAPSEITFALEELHNSYNLFLLRPIDEFKNWPNKTYAKFVIQWCIEKYEDFKESGYNKTRIRDEFEKLHYSARNRHAMVFSIDMINMTKVSLGPSDPYGYYINFNEMPTHNGIFAHTQMTLPNVKYIMLYRAVVEPYLTTSAYIQFFYEREVPFNQRYNIATHIAPEMAEYIRTVHDIKLDEETQSDMRDTRLQNQVKMINHIARSAPKNFSELNDIKVHLKDFGRTFTYFDA